MNYKKIIPSRKLRIKILSLLNWIPDKVMIALQYKIHTGRSINWRHPERFTEKLQLYKVFHRDSIMLRCTDKYEVREVIRELGYGEHLIPLIGVYKDVSEIDFDSLPDQFVAKSTDGGGGSEVLVCKDKNALTSEEFYSRIKEWMNKPCAKQPGREWAYENGFPRKIVIEKLLQSQRPQRKVDYRVYCIDGQPKYFSSNIEVENNGVPEIRDMKGRRIILPPHDCNQESDEDKVLNDLEIIKEISRIKSQNKLLAQIDIYKIDNARWFAEPKSFNETDLKLFSLLVGKNYTKKSLTEIDKDFLVKDQRTSLNGELFFYDDKVDHVYQPGLIDYKFVCFQGKVALIYGVSGRKLGQGAEFGFYSTEWEKLNISRSDEYVGAHTLPKPENLEEMIELAEVLSAKFPHVRVDLYNVNGKIYFGELTFYDGSGYLTYTPDSFDFELGKLFHTF